MTPESDFPPVRLDDMIAAQDLDSNQLIEGRFKRLHQPRKVFRRVDNPQMLDCQFPCIHQHHVGFLKRDREEAI